MEDLQKCLSYAPFIDLQWMRRTGEKQNCYIKELKDNTSQLDEKNHQMKRQLEKVNNEKRQLQSIKNNLAKNKEKEHQALKVNLLNEGTLTEMVALAESRYSEKALERRRALQNSARAQPVIQLRNLCSASELKLKKYRQMREHITEGKSKREVYQWAKKRTSIVELAKLTKELREAGLVLRRMEEEREQLVRETREARERERRPQLGPLQVIVAPDRPTRPSPPSLTPLFNIFSPEDDQSQLSAHNTSENKMEPPAKVPRAAAPRLQDRSLKQICVALVDTMTEGISHDSKQIKVINELTVKKDQLRSIIKGTEMCKLQNVSVIGGDVLATVGLLRETPAQENTEHTEIGHESAPASSLMSPPTQFRDTHQPEQAMEVVEYDNITGSHDEPSKSGDCTQLSLQMDDTFENLPGDMETSGGEFTSLGQENASFTRMKENLMKKFNVTSSPEFVYSKKNDNATVTSKFFPKEVAPSERTNIKESTLEHELRPVLQTQTATVTCLPPPVLATDASVNNIPVAESEETREAGREDEQSVTNPGPATVPELDDSSYDFSSMLDTPSLLLSPRADDIPTYEMNNQLTSIFGVQKPAFPLLKIANSGAPEQNPESGTASQSNTEFNFFQDNKKRGFFSLFN